MPGPIGGPADRVDPVPASPDRTPTMVAGARIRAGMKGRCTHMSTEATTDSSTTAGSTETIEFQAEARQLLQLMIHSIYSTKDVFLRELISNASDALDKLRLAAYQDKDLQVDVSDLHIWLETDPAERTVSVRDNGIGMTRDEVIDLIGTIAKSGTAEMLKKLRQARESGGGSEQATAELIGQFGVGFYSCLLYTSPSPRDGLLSRMPS